MVWYGLFWNTELVMNEKSSFAFGLTVKLVKNNDQYYNNHILPLIYTVKR